MKNKFNLFVVPLFLLLASCAANGNMIAPGGMYYEGAPENMDTNEETDNNEYLKIKENDFIYASEKQTSSFTLDSSSAAYTNLRSAIQQESSIYKDQIIIEQLINYFDYSYIAPVDQAVAIYNETAICPWNENHLLTSVAVKTKEIKYDETVNNNYVLLIDVSGSMSSKNKLPLVKKGFCYLVDNLNENDVVSIVTYSGSVSTPLKGAKGSEKIKIKRAINELKAGGSTAGGSGIEKAYSLASDYFIEGGNNMILMATDGDFNVGVSSFSELETLIKDKRERYNISFSTFGFGMGNYKDSNMQTLALHGDGNVYYIDSELEAERLFTGNISSILNVVAKDAKIQLSFNPENVSQYRLIGYENKLLTDEEFQDNRTDAGEIYSNRSVIALYEIIPNQEKTSDYLYDIDFRYKEVNSDTTISLTSAEDCIKENPSLNHIFASCVSEFALVLRDSKYKSNASYASVIERLENNEELLQDPLKNEFLQLVKTVLEKEITAL